MGNQLETWRESLPECLRWSEDDGRLFAELRKSLNSQEQFPFLITSALADSMTAAAVDDMSAVLPSVTGWKVAMAILRTRFYYARLLINLPSV